MPLHIRYIAVLSNKKVSLCLDMFYMGIRRVDYCISAVILPAADYSKTIQISIVLIYEVCVVTIYHITLQKIISFIEKYQPDNASLTNLSKTTNTVHCK